MTEYLQFASRGENAWWRYLASCVAGLALAMLVLVLVAFVLTALRVLPLGIAAEIQQPRNAPVFFLGTGAIFGAFMVGLMAAMILIQRKLPSDIVGRWRWPLFFWGVGLWAVVQGILGMVDFIIAPQGFAFSASSATVTLAVGALVGLSIQTFAEEFVFRGYLTQAIILAVKRPLPTAIISGVLFGAIHIPNGIPQAINALVFGIVCALIAIRTGGICLTFGLHLANNFFGAVVLVSTGDVFRNSPGLFTQDTPQLLWSDLGLAIFALLGFLWLVLRDRNSIFSFPQAFNGERRGD